MIGLTLFISFVLVSTSKLMKANMFMALMTSIVKIQGLQAHLRESFPLNRRASLLLLVNYHVSFSLVLFLFQQLSIINLDYSWWINLFVPFTLLAYSIIGMVFTGILTGERSVFAEPLAMKVVGAQVLGLIYSILGLISALYHIEITIFLQLVVGIFLLESGIRMVKSVLVVLARGVSWYYIILYFCTLEILPLFVAYYVILRNFTGK